MAFKIQLQQSEILLYQDYAYDPKHPMSFGITDRAIFLMREQNLRIEKYYMHRVPLDEIKNVTLYRERGFRAWFLGGVSTLFGLLALVALTVSYYPYNSSVKPSATAFAGALGFLIVGLLMLFDSRWRMVLSINTKSKKFRFKPSIFSKREEARRLQESFLTYCRYFSIPTRRVDLTNQRENGEFWKWFYHKRFKIAQPEIQIRLSKLADGLVCYVPTNQRLILSADYKKDLFPVVEELFDSMPEIPDWEITLFRGRENVGSTFIYAGETYQTNDYYFVPYTDGFSLALAIYGDFDDSPQSGDAAIELLRRLLGEEDFTLGLTSINLASRTDEPDVEGMLPIRELPDYFEDFVHFD